MVEGYADKGVTYIAHDRCQGACVTRNTGLSHARGEFIGFLDDDDEWCNVMVERLLTAFDENDVALDPICWYADFAADKNATGWQNAVNAHEPTSEEFRNVVWKDWTTIGVNLT
jgi:glycosyltransferase involved in cell wall biosynthesis